jgi:hypothetical protein
MSFLDVGGASKWSQVVIDADKNMGGFGLTDLKEIALGMNVGDILCFNAATNQLAKVSIGAAGTELLTKGQHFPPVWSFPDVG